MDKMERERKKEEVCLQPGVPLTVCATPNTGKATPSAFPLCPATTVSRSANSNQHHEERATHRLVPPLPTSTDLCEVRDGNGTYIFLHRDASLVFSVRLSYLSFKCNKNKSSMEIYVYIRILDESHYGGLYINMLSVQYFKHNN